jgi:hypothetical protein
MIETLKGSKKPHRHWLFDLFGVDIDFARCPVGCTHGYSHSGPFGPGPSKRRNLINGGEVGASDGQRIVTDSYDHPVSVWDAARTRTERFQKLFEGIRSRTSHEGLKGRCPSQNADRMLASPSFVGPRNKNNNKKAKRNMKAITKTLMYLQMAALCFVTAFADPSLKEKDFSGPIASVETADIDFATLIMLVDGSGTGQAEHLGQFTYTYEFVVDLATLNGVGSAEFTAANGDSFSTEITASASMVPGGNRVVEEHTIVGGTGRFAGASGSFTLDRFVTTIGTTTTNVSVGTVEGTIVTLKSK